MEGTAFDLALLDKDYIRVTVDLSNVSRTGVQTVTSVIYGYTEEYFRQNITVSDRTPSVITINVAELYHKTVDVRCEISGNVAEGYSAGELQVSPTEIEVRGDQEDVDAVSYAKVTLDLGEDATSTVTERRPSSSMTQTTSCWRTPASRPQRGDHSGDAGICHPGAATDHELRGVRRRPHVQRGLGIEPSTILVSGPADVLNSMDSIVLDDFNLAELGSTTNYSYAIPIPEGCENLSGVTRATPRISFKDMRRTTVTATNFILENAPEDRTVDLLTEQLAVSIFGTSGDVGGHYLGQHSGDGGPGGLRLRRGHLHCPRGGDGGGARRGRLRRDVSGACHHF